MRKMVRIVWRSIVNFLTGVIAAAAALGRTTEQPVADAQADVFYHLEIEEEVL